MGRLSFQFATRLGLLKRFFCWNFYGKNDEVARLKTKKWYMLSRWKCLK